MALRSTSIRDCGLAVAVAFGCLSLTPSLVPRALALHGADTVRLAERMRR